MHDVRAQDHGRDRIEEHVIVLRPRSAPVDSSIGAKGTRNIFDCLLESRCLLRSGEATEYIFLRRVFIVNANEDIRVGIQDCLDTLKLSNLVSFEIQICLTFLTTLVSLLFILIFFLDCFSLYLILQIYDL